MKEYIVFTLILLLMERQVNADIDARLGAKFKNDAPNTHNIEDKHFKEKGVKWDIDLGDMLNFNKQGPVGTNEKQSTLANIKEPTSANEKQSTSANIKEPTPANVKHPLPGKTRKASGKSVKVLKVKHAFEEPSDTLGNINKHNRAAEAMKFYEDVPPVTPPIRKRLENENVIELDAEHTSSDLNLFKRHIEGYVLRYVNLLLYALNLKDKSPPGKESEEVKVNFDFVVKRKDLKTLQSLSKTLNKNNIIDKLYHIDAIISRSLYLKEKNTFFDEFMAFMKKSEFTKDWLKSKNAYFLIFATAALFMIAVKNFAGFSYKFIFIVMINNVIVLEGIFSYWIKLKEATIADHVERMRYKSVPLSCSGEDRTLLTKVYDWFVEDECLAYHKTMQMNKGDKIFPLESVVHAYTFYLAEMPFKIVGTSFRAFIVSINDHFPNIIQPLGTAITQYLLLVCVFIFLLFLLGLVIRVNLWGARLELGFRQWLRNRRHYPEDDDPPQYRRVRDLPRSAVREMEKEFVQQPPEYLEEGSDSVSEVVKDSGKMEHRQVEGSPIEENSGIEIVNEDVRNDNVSLISEERNLSQDIKTAKKLLAELKTNE